MKSVIKRNEKRIEHSWNLARNWLEKIFRFFMCCSSISTSKVTIHLLINFNIAIKVFYYRCQKHRNSSMVLIFQGILLSFSSKLIILLAFFFSMYYEILLWNLYRTKKRTLFNKHFKTTWCMFVYTYSKTFFRIAFLTINQWYQNQ